MAINPNTRACTHIKVNGIRCGSPSLRREVFCYFHQRMIRGVRTPPKSRLHPIAMLEDQESIQASLMEIVNALVRNQIDVPRARLVLRALSIAVRNAGKVRFDCWQNEMVQEIPEYPAAPTVARPFAVAAAQAAALTTITAAQNKEAKSDRRSAFRPAPADVPRTETQRTGVQRTDVPRKPPASVRRMARSRPAARSRAG